MTEALRDLAIQGDISMISGLEGLKREKKSVDSLEKEVFEHLIVDLREDKAVKTKTKP